MALKITKKLFVFLNANLTGSLIQKFGHLHNLFKPLRMTATTHNFLIGTYRLVMDCLKRLFILYECYRYLIYYNNKEKINLNHAVNKSR